MVSFAFPLHIMMLNIFCGFTCHAYIVSGEVYIQIFQWVYTGDQNQCFPGSDSKFSLPSLGNSYINLVELSILSLVSLQNILGLLTRTSHFSYLSLEVLDGEFMG